MSQYNKEFPFHVAFPLQIMTNVLAEWLASKGAKQAHIAGYVLLVTADHDNAEQMRNAETGAPHTARTCNPVPFIIALPEVKHSHSPLRDPKPRNLPNLVRIAHSDKLAQELQRACWAARTVDVAFSKSNRAEQYLPFMSTPALPGTAPPGGTQRPDLRRPPSVQSLAMSARGQQMAPSLNPLYQTLLHHCRPADAIPPVPVLPCEPQVLATLLLPFLNPDKSPKVEQDRRYAFESFDIIIKTWKPPNEIDAMERCKWICKAALMPHSTIRVCLLHTLRAVLSSSDFAYHATQATSVQTLATSLFTLLPSVYGSGEEHTIVVEAIVHLFAGDYGVLDLPSVKEQFGIRCVPSETRQESLRHTLILDALALTLENSADSMRRWLLEHVVDEYWPRQPEDVVFTPLLSAIHARKLATFTRMALAGLHGRSSVSTSPSNSTTAEYIVHFVQTRVVPELAAIRQDSILSMKRTVTSDSTTSTSRLAAGADNGSAVDEARRNVVGIGLELLHPGAGARELALWAMTVLSEWYRDTEGKKNGWKTSIDEAVQRVISESPWPAVLSVLSALLDGLPEDVRKPPCGRGFTNCYNGAYLHRLTYDPPSHPSLPLTVLLTKLAAMYSPTFYKLSNFTAQYGDQLDACHLVVSVVPRSQRAASKARGPNAIGDPGVAYAAMNYYAIYPAGVLVPLPAVKTGFKMLLSQVQFPENNGLPLYINECDAAQHVFATYPAFETLKSTYAKYDPTRFNVRNTLGPIRL
ncbi:hypothetical protein C8F01DRAFT_1246337 [Mycena amicta]|nr:hypothetical protein C8F01DRAFT_1246337 [Mycena amicta]